MNAAKFNSNIFFQKTEKPHKSSADWNTSVPKPSLNRGFPANDSEYPQRQLSLTGRVGSEVMERQINQRRRDETE